MFSHKRIELILCWLIFTALSPNIVYSADNIESKLKARNLVTENNYIYILVESKIAAMGSSNQHLESKLITLAKSHALNYFCNKHPNEVTYVKANLYGIRKHKVIISDNTMKVIVKVPIQNPECNYKKLQNHEQNNNSENSKHEESKQFRIEDDKTIQLDNKTEY